MVKQQKNRSLQNCSQLVLRPIQSYYTHKSMSFHDLIQINSTDKIVAVIWLCIVYFIVVPTSIYLNVKFYKQRNNNFIHKRRPFLVLLCNSMAIYYISIHAPLYIFLLVFFDPSMLPSDYAHREYLIDSIDKLLFIFNEFGYSLIGTFYLSRVWTLYFDFRFNKTMVNRLWKKEISPFSKHFTIKYRNTLGNFKFVLFVACLLTTIASIVVAYVTWTKEIEAGIIASCVFFGVVVILCIILISRFVSKYLDIIGIREELLASLSVSLILVLAVFIVGVSLVQTNPTLVLFLGPIFGQIVFYILILISTLYAFWREKNDSHFILSAKRSFKQLITNINDTFTIGGGGGSKDEPSTTTNGTKSSKNTMSSGKRTETFSINNNSNNSNNMKYGIPSSPVRLPFQTADSKTAVVGTVGHWKRLSKISTVSVGAKLSPPSTAVSSSKSNSKNGGHKKSASTLEVESKENDGKSHTRSFSAQSNVFSLKKNSQSGNTNTNSGDLNASLTGSRSNGKSSMFITHPDREYRTMNALLTSHSGFTLFAQHLVKEYSLENLLFVVECTQFKLKHKELFSQEFRSRQLFNQIALPQSLPESQLLEDYKDFESRFVALYRKYIHPLRSPWQINISSNSRKQLSSFYHVLSRESISPHAPFYLKQQSISVTNSIQNTPKLQITQSLPAATGSTQPNSNGNLNANTNTNTNTNTNANTNGNSKYIPPKPIMLNSTSAFTKISINVNNMMPSVEPSPISPLSPLSPQTSTPLEIFGSVEDKTVDSTTGNGGKIRTFASGADEQVQVEDIVIIDDSADLDEKMDNRLPPKKSTLLTPNFSNDNNNNNGRVFPKLSITDENGDDIVIELESMNNNEKTNDRENTMVELEPSYSTSQTHSHTPSATATATATVTATPLTANSTTVKSFINQQTNTNEVNPNHNPNHNKTQSMFQKGGKSQLPLAQLLANMHQSMPLTPHSNAASRGAGSGDFYRRNSDTIDRYYNEFEKKADAMNNCQHKHNDPTHSDMTTLSHTYFVKTNIDPKLRNEYKVSLAERAVLRDREAIQKQTRYGNGSVNVTGGQSPLLADMAMDVSEMNYAITQRREEIVMLLDESMLDVWSNLRDSFFRFRRTKEWKQWNELKREA